MRTGNWGHGKPQAVPTVCSYTVLLGVSGVRSSYFSRMFKVDVCNDNLLYYVGSLFTYCLWYKYTHPTGILATFLVPRTHHAWQDGVIVCVAVDLFTFIVRYEGNFHLLQDGRESAIS